METDPIPQPEDEEVVEGLPVLASDVRIVEVEPRPVPARQAAALAATGFVAGAATVAIVHRRKAKVAPRRLKRAKKGRALDVLSSSSFLVDVHLLRRD
jgi:hypothetical protein